MTRQMLPLGFHTGVVEAWDAALGTNKIRVLGTVLDNLSPLSASEVGLVRKGDTVGVMRFQNTVFILGRIDGAAAAQRALAVNFAQTVTLSAPTASATYQARNGPSVIVDIGSSRQCFVHLSADITLTNNTERMGFQVSNTPAGTVIVAAADNRALAFSSSATGRLQATRTVVLTAADGLAEGRNVFQTMHQTANHLSSVPLVGEVQLVVQPF